MYTLYTYPFSQHARRVVALLDAAGLEYRSIHIALDKGEQLSDSFRAINPDHAVPVLVDQELVISESNAILRWLCTRHALETWYPNDPTLHAATEQWLDWCQTRLGSAVTDVVLNTVFLGEDGDMDAAARGHKTLEALIPRLENRLAYRPWIAGTETPTIADLALGTTVTHLALANALPQTPAITAWLNRLMKIEAFAKAMPPVPAEA